MKFKTPSFWYNKNKRLCKYALTPFSWLYGLGHMAHQKSAAKPYNCGVPVICAGNVVAGGSGKTPTAIAFLELIKVHNLAEAPFFLTRGYGGDEDKILSQHALTIISADRAEGAREAVERGADLIIMDDGFQNPHLHKDINLIVTDGAMGFGNERLIPAGPLRQPLDKALNKADGFVVIGTDKRDIHGSLPKDKPAFIASFEPLEKLKFDGPYVAFAGLGYPEKFFNFLREDLGANVIESAPFPDHYAYRADDIRVLGALAKKHNAKLITTEKDAMRLPAVDGVDIEVLPVKLKWKNEKSIVEFLSKQIKIARA